VRVGVLLGVILLAIGAWIVSGKATYKTKKSVVDIGVLKADVKEEHQIPKWVGAASLGAGVAVLLISLKRSR
jgi:hypothetical protein